jgi:hypothetical protein
MVVLFRLDTAERRNAGAHHIHGMGRCRQASSTVFTLAGMPRIDRSLAL